jgi:hypothetical protein
MREVMARFYQAYKTALGEEASMGLIAEMNALTDQL